MYGLLLDSIQKFIVEKYGDHYWIALRHKCNLQNHWFMTHEVYSDSVMTALINHSEEVLGINRDQVMQLFGQYFAQTIGRYGYARLLRVLGRDLRDFLNGLDDLHEYLKVSYPKMRPPSFSCEQESSSGLLMHYTTKRRGYLPYVIGQLMAVGKIYGKDLEISVEHEQTAEEGCHVVLRLIFDNYEMNRLSSLMVEQSLLEISSIDFLSIFPFMLSFDSSLTIHHIGRRLNEVLPGLVGQKLLDVFSSQRPMNTESFVYDRVLRHANCTFELLSLSSVHSSSELAMGTTLPKLKLKGQMMPLRERDMVMFLCSPVMNSPEDLYQAGLFISDLAMYDCGRDFILAGSQQSPELSLALSQEKIRSQQLEESIQRTDQLLYQMIPKPIADKLRRGDNPITTCQEMDNVSVLFSDIVKFTPMCTRLKPMQAVSILNSMYVKFDSLSERHHVYKVQTIGDGYMAVSGTPIETAHHAEYITNFAFSLLEAVETILDPSTNKPIQIRIGIHSGPVVVGVVGSSFLRYDVLGDTVNTAARMEATGMAQRIHISDATAKLLEKTKYVLEDRGEMEVKGKGKMKTFWVIQKIPDSSTDHLNPLQRYQYELRRKSTGLTQNGGHPNRSRFHSVATVPNMAHGRPSLPLSSSYMPTIFTTIEGRSNSLANGNMHNLVTSFPRSTKTPPQLHGIRRSLTPGPDEWPEAEQALCSPDDFTMFKDPDHSPENLSDTVQALQPRRSSDIDINKLQLELASLKLSNSPNLAEFVHRLMTHAKNAESLANVLMKMLQVDHSLDSQEHSPHEEVPTVTVAQPSPGLTGTPSSPRMEHSSALLTIKECGTNKAYNKLKTTTRLEDNCTNQHIANHRLHSPVGVRKLIAPSSSHQTEPIYMSTTSSTDLSTKKPLGNVTSSRKSVWKPPAKGHRGVHSSVDKDDSGQYGCTVM